MKYISYLAPVNVNLLIPLIVVFICSHRKLIGPESCPIIIDGTKIGSRPIKCQSFTPNEKLMIKFATAEIINSLTFC